MIKVTDYLIEHLAERGVTHIFMISGGGAMHINDSIGKCLDIQYICNHHEQACAIAAEGYSRVTNGLAVVNVTTGPGGLNTLTGVMGQWTDSVPVLYISGQVKFETTISSCPELALRQLGDQEVDIVSVVKPLTKYAVMVEDPLNIRYEVDKAIDIATSGRPGPVWIDIPMNVQGAMVDETALRVYKPVAGRPGFDEKELDAKILEIKEHLQKAVRPLIVAGRGVKISGSGELLLKFLSSTGIPVVTTFNGVDLVATDHPNYIGHIGTLGSRAGNFVLQNADFVLIVGSRNNIRQVSYNWEYYARSAVTAVVDIDAAELKKPTLKPDIAVHADAGIFLKRLEESLKGITLPDFSQWREWGLERKHKYPVVLPEYRDVKNGVHPYYFMDILTGALDEKSVLVAGNGSACVVAFQAGNVKQGQTILWNSGCASMGYDLPAAIGACFANNGKDVICIAGDGSIMMNLQELETVAYHKLPVKIFILNNDGYISIKQTQENFFEKRYCACGQESGVGFPDFVRLAESFDIPAVRISSHDKLDESISAVLKTPGPVLCEIMLLTDYIFSPKLSSKKLPDGRMISRPLEDMYPFLDDEELKSNMIVPVIEV